MPSDIVYGKSSSDIENVEWNVGTAQLPNVVRFGSGSSQASQNSGDICRICHCESDPHNPLLTPCYCSGSLKYVHQTCLQQWLTASETNSCELCKFPFIMHTKIKPFNEWRSLDMSGVERRRLFCAVLFHCAAALCVIWSLCVLIERAAEEVKRGLIGWPFWTKLVVVTVGLTGGVVFMYIQCRQYLHLCHRWRARNRILLIQNAPEKIHPLSPPSPVRYHLPRNGSTSTTNGGSGCIGANGSNSGGNGMGMGGSIGGGGGGGGGINGSGGVGHGSGGGGGCGGGNGGVIMVSLNHMNRPSHAQIIANIENNPVQYERDWTLDDTSQSSFKPCPQGSGSMIPFHDCVHNIYENSASQHTTRSSSHSISDSISDLNQMPNYQHYQHHPTSNITNNNNNNNNNSNNSNHHTISQSTTPPPPPSSSSSLQHEYQHHHNPNSHHQQQQHQVQSQQQQQQQHQHHYHQQHPTTSSGISTAGSSSGSSSSDGGSGSGGNGGGSIGLKTNDLNLFKINTNQMKYPNSAVFLENSDILNDAEYPKLYHRHSTVYMTPREVNDNLEKVLGGGKDTRRYSDTKLLHKRSSGGGGGGGGSGGSGVSGAGFIGGNGISTGINNTTTTAASVTLSSIPSNFIGNEDNNSENSGMTMAGAGISASSSHNCSKNENTMPIFNVTNVLGSAIPSQTNDTINNVTDIIFENSGQNIFDPRDLNIQEMLDMDIQKQQQQQQQYQHHYPHHQQEHEHEQSQQQQHSNRYLPTTVETERKKVARLSLKTIDTQSNKCPSASSSPSSTAPRTQTVDNNRTLFKSLPNLSASSENLLQHYQQQHQQQQHHQQLK